MKRIKSRFNGPYMKYVIRYTIDFIIIYSLLYLILKMSGKTFFGDTDTIPKFYSAFYYIGESLKNSVKDILSIGTVRPGAFDFRIGQGMDVLTTMSGYGLCDPINLLTLLVSQNYMEWLYKTLIVLRLYLAGIAVLLYLLRMGLKTMRPLLICALAYTILGNAVFLKSGNPLFLSALIYLPLLVLAIERSLKSRRYGWFAVMVGISFISSLYFACINTVLIVIYIVVRIIGIKKETKVSSSLKLAGTYFLGLGMSAVVLVPTVYAVLTGTWTSPWNQKIETDQVENPIQAISTIKDTSFYRVEQPWGGSNQPLLINYNGTAFENSKIPTRMTEYYRGLAMGSLEQPYQCNGQDSRAVVNELSSTKYYVTDSKRKGLVPYGYEAATSKKREDGTKDIVYENKYALGVGYTYLFMMRQSEYETLSPLQKQEALMICAVIPDEKVTDALLGTGKVLTKDQLKFSTHEIYSKIGKINGVRIKESQDGKTTIKVLKKNATIEILYNGEEDSETYLFLKYFQADQGADYNKLMITGGRNLQTAFSIYNKSSDLYFEREYIGVNIGSAKDSKKSITITFPEKGTFSYESLEMYSYPLKKYTAHALSLRDGELQNVSVTGGTISGKTELENAGWMQFSIPYSKGWRAFVDGKETTLIVSDTMYMGLYLEEGVHKVLLTYSTPYMTLGSIISIVAVIGLAISCIISRKQIR